MTSNKATSSLSQAEQTARESVRRAFRGESERGAQTGQGDLERLASESVARAFGREPKRHVAEGELPIQKRDFDAVSIWVATEAAATATRALAQALMRADASKGIYAAEAEAAQIAEEAYTEAAKRSPYEVERQETIARLATKLTEQFSRSAEHRAQKAVKPAPQRRPAAAQEQRESSGQRMRVELREVATHSIRVIN